MSQRSAPAGLTRPGRRGPNFEQHIARRRSRPLDAETRQRGGAAAPAAGPTHRSGPGGRP